MRILVTGGNGFIGTHLVDHLIEEGHYVRVLDTMVRGNPIYDGKHQPNEFYNEDIRELREVVRAVHGMDCVVHLASRLGVGISQSKGIGFVDTNCLGTANLMEAVRCSTVNKIVLASSMSVYGEGSYCTVDRQPVSGVVRRTKRHLDDHLWELVDSRDLPLHPVPTKEDKQPDPQSVYAATKLHQEHLCNLISRDLGISVVTLRLFNVYGPKQDLDHPYSGVMAMFADIILDGRSPKIFEDGFQTRDFAHVYDVVGAFAKAIVKNVGSAVINVASGQSVNLYDACQMLCDRLDAGNEPVVTDNYRLGDVRHCRADITKADQLLGWKPEFDLESGLDNYAVWLKELNDECS